MFVSTSSSFSESLVTYTMCRVSIRHIYGAHISYIYTNLPSFIQSIVFSEHRLHSLSAYKSNVHTVREAIRCGTQAHTAFSSLAKRREFLDFPAEYMRERAVTLCCENDISSAYKMVATRVWRGHCLASTTTGRSQEICC